MRPLPLLLLAATLAAPLAAPLVQASAQPAGEALAVARGRAVAETWCANCHLVGEARSGADAAPSFAGIAQRRPQPEALRTWLAQQHKAAMPNYNLSRDEVASVVAYILSLAR